MSKTFTNLNDLLKFASENVNNHVTGEKVINCTNCGAEITVKPPLKNKIKCEKCNKEIDATYSIE